MAAALALYYCSVARPLSSLATVAAISLPSTPSSSLFARRLSSTLVNQSSSSTINRIRLASAVRFISFPIDKSNDDQNQSRSSSLLSSPKKYQGREFIEAASDMQSPTYYNTQPWKDMNHKYNGRLMEYLKNADIRGCLGFAMSVRKDFRYVHITKYNKTK